MPLTRRTSKQNDFLDAVMDLMPGGSFSRQDVTILAFDIFVAGSDNITTAVEKALAELLRNSSIMAKVRAEIHGALAADNKQQEGVTETVAASLPYLQAVVKETMRLHPMLPLLVPHHATEEGMEISGYTVPKLGKRCDLQRMGDNA
jgi:cytochrome P450